MRPGPWLCVLCLLLLLVSSTEAARRWDVATTVVDARCRRDNLHDDNWRRGAVLPRRPASIERVLGLRGGVKQGKSSSGKSNSKKGGTSGSGSGKAGLKVNSLTSKKSLLKTIKEGLAEVKPATRVYMLLSVACTLVHMVGLPAPELFALSASRWFELWRPLTAMAYLGGPSMSMANSAYFLVRYGQQLETLNGLGAHAWFLLVQTVILSLLGMLLGFPNMAQAMIAATVYVSSHLNPMERMPFQFGFVITSWQLPFAMMAIDCLSQQNAAAAWPHVLGIFSGHCFHFFTKIWPALGGRAWLETPKWFVNLLGGAPRSNVAGVNLSSGRGTGDKKTLKRKGSGAQGRKLGGAAPP